MSLHYIRRDDGFDWNIYRGKGALAYVLLINKIWIIVNCTKWLLNGNGIKWKCVFTFHYKKLKTKHNNIIIGSITTTITFNHNINQIALILNSTCVGSFIRLCIKIQLNTNHINIITSVYNLCVMFDAGIWWLWLWIFYFNC